MCKFLKHLGTIHLFALILFLWTAILILLDKSSEKYFSC